MIPEHVLFYALVGGILPALLWLWFWLKEDSRCPEPRGLIILSFIAGMIVVPLVFPLQKLVAAHFVGTTVIVLWSTVEEVLKFLAAYLLVLRRKDMDEPVDAIIYMITVALGFAAFENTLFLINPLGDGNIIESVLTGNLRFIGAMVLHTLASAVIGVAIALSFYKSALAKRIYIFFGIILAIVLHTLFNFFIIQSNGEKLLEVFIFVWLGIVVLILFFEKIKRMKNPRNLFIKKR
ncbi:PrsW family intramembrane metalloprotease [Patescibacteria group bacterium]|nr:PrsW family intramembrane metalloprotease [Patescibacteria group bacterium]